MADGANRWPGLNTRDAGSLYRLALEKAPAGTRLHGVEGEGVSFREIAEAVGRHLDVPVRSITAEEAEAHFPFPLSMLAVIDNPTSNARTRQVLDWSPTHPSLLQDLEQRHYFAPPAS